MTELEKKIKHYQDKYYNGTPEISDKEFDELWELLKKQNPESKLLKDIGETSWDGFPKAKHIMKMGSQDKLNSYDEIKDWIRVKKIQFPLIIQHKLDGLSVELQYEKGTLKKVVSRGNGDIGDNFIENGKKMIGVPKKINEDFTGAIRGEIVLTRENFNKYFSDAKNPRNMASGIAKRKDGKDCEKLTVITYDVYKEEGFGFSFEFEIDKIQFLAMKNFKVVEGYEVENYEDLIDVIEYIKDEREKFDVSIDGIVIKQNKIVKSDLERKRPEYQRAYKFEDETVKTKIIDVEWSRNGYNYTPVAILKPVELNETVVKRASLANIDNIDKLGIKINDIVLIRKANEIIPQILKVVEKAENRKEIQPPETCELCDTKLEITGVRVYCPNPYCEGRKRHKVEKWIEKTGVKGFGPALLDFLFDEGFVEDIIDLYTIDIEYVLMKTNLKKATAKAFHNLFNIKEMKLETFISGFDIEGIGEGIIKFAVKEGYDTLEKIKNASLQELANIEGIGDLRAEIIKKAFDELYDEMIEMTDFIKIKSEKTDNKLSGKSFCFTGKLNSMSRKEAQELVIKNGGEAKSGVSKTLDFLVNNDNESSSSKNKKAKELGIPIITESEFLEMIKPSN